MSTLDTQERAWDAVLARDRSRDRDFVYAVATTGVYCRPGCPSRRPLRRNVRFFDGPDAAQRAGFRACRRCRPDAERGSTTDELVTGALAYLDGHVDENVTLQRLAGVVGSSPFHLQREFTRRTGMAPRQYLTSLRLTRFRNRVRAGEPVSAATYQAGFGSSRALYAASRIGLGMTPGAYARAGRALEIAYAIEDCTLGRVLVASTADGVCAVMLGERDEGLVPEIEAEFRSATLVRADLRRDWTRHVVRHIDDTHLPLAVPLDYHGTPFQVRVWKALREIPAGERRTYSELAGSLRAPRAVRAVGRACASNSIAVLVPCHRVVRKDGGLAGYRWGIERKAALLAREADRAS